MLDKIPISIVWTNCYIRYSNIFNRNDDVAVSSDIASSRDSTSLSITYVNKPKSNGLSILMACSQSSTRIFGTSCTCSISTLVTYLLQYLATYIVLSER